MDEIIKAVKDLPPANFKYYAYLEMACFYFCLLWLPKLFEL